MPVMPTVTDLGGTSGLGNDMIRSGILFFNLCKLSHYTPLWRSKLIIFACFCRNHAGSHSGCESQLPTKQHIRSTVPEIQT